MTLMYCHTCNKVTECTYTEFPDKYLVKCRIDDNVQQYFKGGRLSLD